MRCALAMLALLLPFTAIAKPYPAAERQAFLESCAVEASKAMPDPKGYCQCMLDHLEANVPFEELLDLSIREIQAPAQRCVEEAGLAAPGATLGAGAHPADHVDARARLRATLSVESLDRFAAIGDTLDGDALKAAGLVQAQLRAGQEGAWRVANHKGRVSLFHVPREGAPSDEVVAFTFRATRDGLVLEGVSAGPCEDSCREGAAF